MEPRTVRDTRILLPGIEPDELLPAELADDGEPLDDCLITGSRPGAHLAGLTIRRSRVESADLSNAVIKHGAFTAVEFLRLDLTGATLTRTTVERCLFSGCRITAARLTEVTLKNVIFENCRLDYTTWEAVKATGPVAVIGCTLADATMARGQLPGAVFQDCQLNRLHFDQMDLRTTDLRENDLSELRGVLSLRGATVTGTQLPDLSFCLARDLGLVVKETA